MNNKKLIGILFAMILLVSIIVNGDTINIGDKIYREEEPPKEKIPEPQEEKYPILDVFVTTKKPATSAEEFLEEDEYPFPEEIVTKKRLTAEEYEQLEAWKKRKAQSTGEPRPLVAASQFLTYYEEYKGFARFGSLFFTSDGWERHREKINQIFCDTILLGGTQCWTSRICDTQLYPLVPRSVFAGRTPSGERTATASIQGEKSLTIQGVDDFDNPVTLRLYKTTYAINNPYEEQTIEYNIQYRTEDGFKINWFNDSQTIPPGTSAKRTEANPLIDYGKNDYTEACIIFHPSIIDYRNYLGRRIREWCTPIIEYVGTATKPYPTATNTTEETPTPQAPEELPQTSGKTGF